MPFELTWEPRGLYKRYWGHLTAEEFLESLAVLHNDPRFDDLKYTINDFLEMTSYQVDPAALNSFVAQGIGASRSNPRVVVAVLAVEERVLGLVRQYQEKSAFKLEIFPDEASARQWIQAQYS